MEFIEDTGFHRTVYVFYQMSWNKLYDASIIEFSLDLEKGALTLLPHNPKF